MPIDITTTGASPASADNTAALLKAVAAALRADKIISVPYGTFRYASQIPLNGASLQGAPGATLLATNRQSQGLALQGSGAFIDGITLKGPGDGRLTTYAQCGITVLRATNFRISGNIIDSPNGAGIHVSGSAFGKIINNTLSNTGADSIHHSNYEGPNHDIEVFGNLIDNGGDDGVAVVSYASGQPSYNINIHDNAVTNQRNGRGYTVVGGHDCQIHNNYYNNNLGRKAGIYISAEAEWNTLPVTGILVQSNTIVAAGGDHGSIQLYASSGTVTNVKIDGNLIFDSRAQDILLNGGGGQAAIVITNNRSNKASFALTDSAGAKPQTGGNVSGAGPTPTLAQWIAPVPPTVPPAPTKADLSFTLNPVSNPLTGASGSGWLNCAVFGPDGKKLAEQALSGGRFTIPLPPSASGAAKLVLWDSPAGQPFNNTKTLDFTLAPTRRQGQVILSGKVVATFDAPDPAAPVSIAYVQIPLT